MDSAPRGHERVLWLIPSGLILCAVLVRVFVKSGYDAEAEKELSPEDIDAAHYLDSGNIAWHRRRPGSWENQYAPKQGAPTRISSRLEPDASPDSSLRPASRDSYEP